MATFTITPTQTFISGDTVLPATLNQLAQSTVALTAGTIVAADIASDAVTTAKIADANVTAAKLATSAVETAKIADDAVTNDKLSLAANAGEIKKALNANNDPPIYACRAWVNFDGTAGSTVDGEFRCTIRESGNVTKVVRNSAGTYTATFATAMPDGNCAAIIAADRGASVNGRSSGLDTVLAGSITFSTTRDGVGGENMENIRVAIFR
jgi:hypothetical protein